MKKLFRALAICSTAAIGFVSLAAFTACDTNYPEVTITYEFNGETYEVDYILTRKGAPQTVQHFIELADAGYYEDTVIHNYVESGTFLYGGGYTWDPLAEDAHGGLVEKDYWKEVRRLEEEKNITFTQTVFARGRDMSGYLADLESDSLSYTVKGKSYGAEDEEIPLYTLHGEFSDNGAYGNSKSYSHNRQGTLGMYYTDKGTNNVEVRVVRRDGGADNVDKDPYDTSVYKTNGATSLFYTFTGAGSRTDLDSSYTAFGRTKDYSQMQALLTAIGEYADGLDENDSFTESQSVLVNQYDPIDTARNAKISLTYDVPTVPIYIRSVKVKKY